MKILLTGGTGFLGRRIVSELSDRHALRLLVRRGSSRERFPAGVEFAEGDVTDRPSLDRALAGCDAVIHAAALVKILAPRHEFDRINVRGLEKVLAAAEEAGSVERMLYISSFMALGPTDGRVLDESAEPRDRSLDQRLRAHQDPLRPRGPQGDRRRRAAQRGLPRGDLRPGGDDRGEHRRAPHPRSRPRPPAGPDRQPRPALELRLRGRRRPRRRPRPGGARARRPPGGRYMLGGDNVTLGQFYGLIGQATGAKIPTLRFPDAIAKAAGAAQKAWAGLRGTTPQLTPDLVEVYKHDWAYNSAKAEKELGYRWRTLAEGLASTVAWLKETGQMGNR